MDTWNPGSCFTSTRNQKLVLPLCCLWLLSRAAVLTNWGECWYPPHSCGQVTLKSSKSREIQQASFTSRYWKGFVAWLSIISYLSNTGPPTLGYIQLQEFLHGHYSNAQMHLCKLWRETEMVRPRDSTMKETLDADGRKVLYFKH